jgi:hypothetical protein
MKPSNSRSSSQTQLKNLDLNRLEEFRIRAQSKCMGMRKVTNSRELVQTPSVKKGERHRLEQREGCYRYAQHQLLRP